jgi:hypothetical protein
MVQASGVIRLPWRAVYHHPKLSPAPLIEGTAVPDAGPVTDVPHEMWRLTER